MIAILAALAAGLTGLSQPATASTAVEKCDPSPRADASYCGSFAGAITSTVAGEPFGLTVSIANTSPKFNSSKAVWTRAARVSVGVGSTGGEPIFTPSRLLDDGLAIATSPLCPDSALSRCAAGSGSFRIALSNATPSLANGTYNGSFGIRRIVNVRDTGATDDVHFRADARICIDIPFLRQCLDQPLDFRIPQDGAGGVPSVEIPMRFTQSFELSGFSGDADVTLRALRLRLEPTSSRLADGRAASRTFTVATVPAVCGPATARTTFTSVDGRSLSFEERRTLTRCPTETSVKARGKGRRTLATGVVGPGKPAGKVRLKLLRRQSGAWRKVDSTRTKLDRRGRFSTRLARKKGGSCRIQAVYPGRTPLYLPSRATSRFRC